MVAFLKKRTHLRADLVQSLGSVEDATRIVQKFLAGRGDTNDLLAVRNTIDVWESIRSRMQMERDTELQGSSAALGDEWNSPNMLMEGMCDLRPLADSINLALVKGDAPLIPAETQFNGVGTDLTDVTEADVDRVLSSTVTGEWAVRPGYVLS